MLHFNLDSKADYSILRNILETLRSLPFIFWPLLPIHCTCRGLFLHLITLNNTCTLGRTPLDEASAHRRGLYLHNTQHSQQTHTVAPGRIRTRNPSKQAATGLRFIKGGHRDQRFEKSVADTHHTLNISQNITSWIKLLGFSVPITQEVDRPICTSFLQMATRFFHIL
jgi:hypothetical protein